MPRAPTKPMLTLACATVAVLATQASAQDRYGPSPATGFGAGVVPGQAAAAMPLRVRFLSWPGKSAARAPAAAAVSAPMAQAALQGRFPTASAPIGRNLATYRAAPVSGDGVWRPVPLRSPDDSRATALAGTPQPYRPQPAASSRWGVASADPAAPGADHVRFYSLHRQYGLQPDPPPIPPQFFAATADMSQPAGPIPVQRLTSTTGGASTTRTVRGTDTSDGSAQP